MPADPAPTHEAIEETVGEVVDAGRDPDRPRRRSLDRRAGHPRLRGATGRSGLVHFDTHTDTGEEVFGVEVSHGTPMYRLVEQGHVDPSRYVQIGLRGYWPGERSSAGRPSAASPASSCTTSATSGSPRWSTGRSPRPARGPVFLSVDVDVLDPAFAPGTGTPEPGGMTSRRPALGLPRDRRRSGARRRRRGRGDPDRVGSADITALVAERIVREIVTGIALRRRG